MEDIKTIIIPLGIIGLIVYTYYRSLFAYKKLTNYQQTNRWNILSKQIVLISSIAAICYGIEYLLRTIYPLLALDFELDKFLVFFFSFLAIVAFIFFLKLNAHLNSIDERVVNIKQEATFANFTPEKRVVKQIRHYSHYFNGITIERSAKDYTIQKTKLNMNIDELNKFKTIQESKEVEMNELYTRLIAYINEKAKIFNYPTITKIEIDNCKNLLEFKLLIFDRFKNFNKKQYFSSISQLFQIANNDETQFISFLRDSQHGKFSTMSINHACLFISLGVIK